MNLRNMLDKIWNIADQTPRLKQTTLNRIFTKNDPNRFTGSFVSQ